MPRVRLALRDKSTQASTSCTARPQRLFVDSEPSLKEKFKKFALRFLLVLWKVLDHFWRFVPFVFKFLNKYFIMLAKHIYKLTCRVMLLDTRILRSAGPAARISPLMVLCVLPLSFFAGLWLAVFTSDVTSDKLMGNHSTISSCSEPAYPALSFDHPENNEIPFENQSSSTHEQKLAAIPEYSESNVEEHVTSDEVINGLIQTGVIQNTVEDYIDKKFEDQDFFKLQRKLELKVAEQREIINALIDELHKMRTDMKFIQNIQPETDTDSDKFFKKYTKIFASFLNNPDSLNKHEAFKNWLRTLFVTKDELEMKFKIYDADKTGLVDYALESMGGEIVTTGCTKIYSNTAVMTFLGVPVFYPTKSPRVVIEPEMFPGNCWAFEDFPGVLVIKLIRPIYIESFSVEHISKFLVPRGKIDAAPKDVEVYGLSDEQGSNSFLIAEFKYDYNGESLQFFKASELDMVFEYVEVRINSNHGNPRFTCLYRFRVHGQPA